MALYPECFYSNRVEVLFERFKERLFENSHPLTRRLVIVSEPLMRTWILQRMAKEFDVAAGVEIGLIEPTLKKLRISFSSSSNMEAPSSFVVALALEKEIMKTVQAFEGLSYREKTIWQPLYDYLAVQSHPKSSYKVVKRVHALSLQLANLFLEYGKIGGSIVSEWNQKEQKGWQERLWLKLEEVFEPWNYPSRQFSEFNIEIYPLARDLQVHLFGVSYLSALHHRFLSEIGRRIPLSYYWLSPCQKFWSDLVSDKERQKLFFHFQEQAISVSRQEELDDYQRDTNPLLANFGKLGRKMAFQIENSDFLISDAYILSNAVLKQSQYENLIGNEILFEESNKSLTLLDAIQADLVLLRNPNQHDRIDLPKYDQTFQIHEASKPLREVQIIYDRILAIIDQHRQDEDPIQPNDIIVMAPEINKYSPFIRSVFECDESLLKCQIMDLALSSHNPLIKGFLHLLRLSFSRWEATSILKLFECEAFQRRHKLTKEDVLTFKRWIKEADIRWGKDVKHRNELLKRDHCLNEMVEESWAGTWEHGLGRLLEGLAIWSDEETTGPFSPLEEVQSTQGELLGILLHLLNSLADDLRPLSDRTAMTLEKWSTYLKCLLESYFSKSNRSEDEEGYNELVCQLEAFMLASKKLDQAEFEFHSILGYLERALQERVTIHRETFLHTVRFCSLQPMRAIPAKVIVLMGMQDGEFPRDPSQLSLNLMNGNVKADYFPSKVEFDRYLFLEALLSARCYFLMSYVSYTSGGNGKALPSLLLTELMNYVRKAYTIQGEDPIKHCWYQHPFLPFDRRYFSKEKKLFSYSKMYYLAARAYYHSNEKQMPHCLVPSFKMSLETINEIQEDICITIKELNTFARNPLKAYLNKKLGIYFKKEEDRVLKKEEEFYLSSLESVLLSRKCLLEPSPEIFERAEKSGVLPRGPFREVCKKNVLTRANDLMENLQAYGLQTQDLFSIECSDRYSECEFGIKEWFVPPLHVETSLGKAKITGKLEIVSNQGLVQFSKDGLDSAAKSWPTLLVLCCLIKTYSLPIQPGILFISSGKVARNVDFEDPLVLLSDYLDYYFKGLESPSPLLPEWVPSILEASYNKLEKLFDADGEDAFKPTYDEGLKWFKKNSAHTDLFSAIEGWSPTAQKLFVNLKKAWYSKNKAGVPEADNELV